ncbi:hypothetical protein OG594_16290 [Streptomyces sp. NBC_01214]|uniref:hypothetical protein n=1 Tax=Streptomyces sp. NBC_01214 TaxID=2903777 RepID=UPI002256346B|nr:hypothetical protein [Streptomyces sp. NBC_01214]MCX4803193.1 hypothetical protein [Streptomyces sp. NBC_01214]
MTPTVLPLATRMALRFRTNVAQVQVRAVSVFLRFDGRRETRAVPGRVHTKDKKRVKQEKSSRMAVIAGTGADTDIPNRVIGNGRTGRAQAPRIKMILCHRDISVSVSTSSARSLPADSPVPLEPARR